MTVTPLCIQSETTISVSDALAPGKYLCYLGFVRACVSNEAEGQFDRLGEDCCFWLEIPER